MTAEAMFINFSFNDDMWRSIYGSLSRRSHTLRGEGRIGYDGLQHWKQQLPSQCRLDFSGICSQNMFGHQKIDSTWVDEYWNF